VSRGCCTCILCIDNVCPLELEQLYHGSCMKCAGSCYR
jgi:hypothetical protein